ncbi:MAG: Ig-like domain-containing protein, partial [Lachnospira sp.]
MKNVRKLKRLTMRLKLQWKILLSVLVAGVAFGGILIFANADSSVSLVLTPKQSSVAQGSTSTVIHANLSGTDDEFYDASNPANNGIASPQRLEWTISDEDYDVVKFVNPSSGGDAYLQSVTGTTNPTVYGNRAGAATITASYHSKKFSESGSVVYDNVLATSTAAVYVPINVSVERKRGEQILEEADLMKEGDLITITANTCESNKLFIETSNDASGEVKTDGIVEMYYRDSSKVILKVIGGGSTVITARTADGSGINPLTYTFTVKAEVRFKENVQNAQGHFITHLSSDILNKYMVLSDVDYEAFSYEEIPSNVVYPSKSGVVYRTEDVNIASVAAGTVCGVHAGVTKVSAGLTTIDVGGNESWLTRDTVNIVVPFKKMGNVVSNMNVGDELQLSTSAIASEVTWSTSDNTILQVDSSTGLVKAVSAGTATIYATRVQDELYTVYNMPYQLAYQITVIDGFGLSSVSTSVNIGSTIEIKALVTNQPSKENIKYVVTNQPDAAGVVPTYDLIEVSQSEDGTVFTITGVAPGITQLTVSQNINGVIKSETCVIYVTTPVGEVSINPSSIEINRGDTGTVQLLFNPSGPTNSNVLWSSSDKTVATVEGDSYTATIKGISGGSATITVITEDGLKVATCDVYVREPVTGITLNATTVESTMAIGQYQLVATVKPSGNGVNRNVTWSSSNEAVCKVDENGLVKYVAPGYCTIVCKTEDGAFIATCNFIISIPVETIKLDYTDEIMSKGQTLRITAEVLPLTATNRTVSWESSNTNVCIVDSNGLVEAVGTGSATILCKSLDGGVTAMCNIYVKQPVTSVVLNTTDITVRKGQVFWLNATCLPENADNKIVTWESRDKDVCTVESDGKVTATGAGTTSIICTNVDTGLTAYCIVTVTQPVTGITLNSDYQELWVGAKYAIIPSIEPIDAENKNVTYFSSDTSVATVDEYGVVTALKGGNCIIEVTTEECHLTAACTIVVKEYVSSITLSETDKFMNVGATGRLIAKVGTDTATNKNIVWSSSDNSICSVDAEGNLSANSVGNAVITATAADGSGVTASCIIKVVNPVTGIEIVPSTVRLLVGDSQKVTANVYPENATIKDVVWASANESIATVDEDG